jgi:hypothetical protein
VVPDAELYLRTYTAQIEGKDSLLFPYQTKEEGESCWTPLQSVNRVFYQDRNSPFGHCTMYDFSLLGKMLKESGFSVITRCEFRTGLDPVLLIDTPGRKVESLYLEATIL